MSRFSNISAYHPFALRNAASLCLEFEKNSEELCWQQSSVSHWGTENLVCVRVGGLSWSGCGPQGQPACHFQNTSSISVPQAAPEAACSTEASCSIPEQTVSGFVPQAQTLFYSFACSKTLSQQSQLLAIYEQVMGQRLKAILSWLEFLFIYIWYIYHKFYL